MAEEKEVVDERPYGQQLVDSIIRGDRDRAKALLVQANEKLVGGNGGHFNNIETDGSVDDLLKEIADKYADDYNDEFEVAVYLGDGYHRLEIHIDKQYPDDSAVYLGHSMTPDEEVANKWEEMNRT